MSPGVCGKQAVKLWVGYKIMVSAIIIFSLGQLVLSNYLSTMGVKLAETRTRSATLEENNVVLEGGLDHYYSLKSVADKGNFRSGLTQNSAVVVFGSVKTKVALR